MRKYLIISMSVLLLALVGCKKEVESVSIMPGNISLTVGKTCQLSAAVKPDKAPQDVRWLSSDPEVATVNAVGLVTAIAVGECEISVYADVQKAVCRVTVTAGGNIPGDTTGTNPSDTTGTNPSDTTGINPGDTTGTHPADTTQPESNVLSFTVNGVGFKMVKVEGDTFRMGATNEQGDYANSDERPIHDVVLATYHIGETEVTQALWKAVMGSEPTDNSWKDSYGKGDAYPAYYVSWKDCQVFLDSLNRKLSARLKGRKFALPTEAQWEYAARGGKQRKGYMYAGGNTIEDVAWYTGNSNYKAHPVKGKQSNELGLYDMSGNVYEWCSDWYDAYSSGLQTEPKGPASGSKRVIRGGGKGNYAQNCRVSARRSNNPSQPSDNIGFRLVLLP